MQIAKMGLQFFERLRPVIRFFLEITQPLVVVLPIDVFRRFHVAHYSVPLMACMREADILGFTSVCTGSFLLDAAAS